MKGNIKAYSTAVNAGVITGEDGRKYKFLDSHWQGPSEPQANDLVMFDSLGTHASNVRKFETA